MPCKESRSLSENKSKQKIKYQPKSELLEILTHQKDFKHKNKVLSSLTLPIILKFYAKAQSELHNTNLILGISRQKANIFYRQKC